MTPAQIALARHHTYHLFSQLYGQGVTANLYSYIQVVPELNATLPPSVSFEQFAADHHSLFSLNIFPHESIFRDPSGLIGGTITNQLLAFYDQNNYHPSNPTPPDHICHELDFLAFLCGAETDAWKDPTAARQMQSKQYQFLQAHLLPWLPPFVVALHLHPLPFYQMLADLTLALVDSHFTDVMVAPPTAVTIPTPPELLTDKHVGFKEIAHYLTTPIYSGVFLSREQISQLAQRLNLPCGFGNRVQTLVNVMKTAVQYDTFPVWLDNLSQLINQWQTTYSHQATLYPTLMPYILPWKNQTEQTLHIIHTMNQHIAS